MVVHYGSPDISGIKKEIQKIQHADMVSELEQRVLDKLYAEYRNSGKLYCWKITEAYKELGIADGTYVGTLHDSRYIVIDGECLKLTTVGIRYMDSRARETVPTQKGEEEILKLSPEFHGLGINLKALVKKIKFWFRD